MGVWNAEQRKDEMIIEARAAIKNSVVLVLDPQSDDIPASMEGRLIAASSSCIAIGTLCEVDGETHVILTDEKEDQRVNSKLHSVFNGVIATPGERVVVCLVSLEPLAALPVSGKRSGVEVWVNDDSEPSEIRIVVCKA
jgi:hypothetical protein